MKIKYGLLIIISLCLMACGRSKEPQYYVLNPLYDTRITTQYVNLRIGIDAIHVPDYLDKNELSVFYTPNQSKLDENSLWMESLSSNIERVIKVSLNNLLPGALVENAPWDVKFEPNKHLQIDISQFRVGPDGVSVLNADYVIYVDKNIVRKYTVHFAQKIPVINAQNVASSMNANLILLSRSMARSLARS